MHRYPALSIALGGISASLIGSGDAAGEIMHLTESEALPTGFSLTFRYLWGKLN